MTISFKVPSAACGPAHCGRPEAERNYQPTAHDWKNTMETGTRHKHVTSFLGESCGCGVDTYASTAIDCLNPR
jgi:hypothetical protein